VKQLDPSLLATPSAPSSSSPAGHLHPSVQLQSHEPGMAGGGGGVAGAIGGLDGIVTICCLMRSRRNSWVASLGTLTLTPRGLSGLGTPTSTWPTITSTFTPGTPWVPANITDNMVALTTAAAAPARGLALPPSFVFTADGVFLPFGASTCAAVKTSTSRSSVCDWRF
jgi:hypothetical protein